MSDLWFEEERAENKAAAEALAVAAKYGFIRIRGTQGGDVWAVYEITKRGRRRQLATRYAKNETEIRRWWIENRKFFGYE